MSNKTLPFSKQKLEQIIDQFPTPLHIYDEKALRVNARRLKQVFSWNQGFKEFFAVKATPNPFILKILQAEGFGADCSSLPELTLAENVGISGEKIMFTSNDTPEEEYVKAKELGAIINIDDISHLSVIEEYIGFPELACFRYNPGPQKKGNTIIGQPEDAKYGLTRLQLFEGFRYAKERGSKRFGLHTMVASNELEPLYFVETAQILLDLVVELSQQLGIEFEFINIGGGIGIPYKPADMPVDIELISQKIEKLFENVITKKGFPPLKLYMEVGRMITGPFGYLVSKVRHIKKTYKNFAGLDSCMANLMRPAMYGAYHHITVLGKENEPNDTLYDVTGSLCENNDKFAIDRRLPRLERGDILIIHDTGAHGHAMGFNYNGKLRSAEVLLREDGQPLLIRRAESLQDYFATLEFDKVHEMDV